MLSPRQGTEDPSAVPLAAGDCGGGAIDLDWRCVEDL